MVNRIPNGSMLTNKLGLLNSLQDYSRICNTIQKRPVSLDFLPETYRLDDPKDREAFTGVFRGQYQRCRVGNKPILLSPEVIRRFSGNITCQIVLCWQITKSGFASLPAEIKAKEYFSCELSTM
jgi:hypothetical protein